MLTFSGTSMGNSMSNLVEIRLNEIERIIDRMLLIGPPGIGKTEKIIQLSMLEAKELGREFIDLRKADSNVLEKIVKEPNKYYVFYRIIVSHVMPEDLSVPKTTENFVRFIPPQTLYVMTLPDIAGTLFLDEITNVHRPDQLSTLLSFVYEKEISWNIKLSDNIKIVMAGNTPRSSAIANLLPDPLITRSVVLYVAPPTPEEWIEYMHEKYNEEWEKIIGMFLLHYKHFIFYDRNSEQGENDNENELIGSGERLLNYATPRTWTTLAVQLYNLKQKGISYSSPFVRSVIVGSVGPYVANHLYPIISKNINIEKAFRELVDNPNVVNIWDVTTRIIIASFLFEKLGELKPDKVESVLKDLLEVNREFVLMSFLAMKKEKRLEWVMKYPFLLNKLAKNELMGEIMKAMRNINLNASYV